MFPLQVVALSGNAFPGFSKIDATLQKLLRIKELEFRGRPG
jgi:hypothetical protein